MLELLEGTFLKIMLMLAHIKGKVWGADDLLGMVDYFCGISEVEMSWNILIYE